MSSYYQGKVIATLQELFGSDKVTLEADAVRVGDRRYPIVDDVIVALDPSQYPPALARRLNSSGGASRGPAEFAEDIQFTFGEEWKSFPEILPEHSGEFAQYFDLVDLPSLATKRVCDLGCGIGRWSYFLKDKCRELVLVDFSEAIFVARKNLKSATNAVFIMGDIKALPFRDDFADFVFCLGVLHHLPSDALGEVRELKRYSPDLLIYRYYALDNRPLLFRSALPVVTLVRNALAHVRSGTFRMAFSWFGAVFIYAPLVAIGTVLAPFGLARHVPLYEGYQKRALSA